MTRDFWGQSPLQLRARTYNGANTALPLLVRTVTYKKYAPIRAIAERLSSHCSPFSQGGGFILCRASHLHPYPLAPKRNRVGILRSRRGDSSFAEPRICTPNNL